MKHLKVVSVLLVLLIVFSVGSFAATTTQKNAQSTTAKEVDNAQRLEEDLIEFMDKNGIDKEKVTFGYQDFNRELRYTYHGDRLFVSKEAIKFPVAYVYFKDLVNGKHHLNEDIGDDNLRTVYMRSLKKDYGHDEGSTAALVNHYGGWEIIKSAMHEITYTKVDDAFYQSDALSAEFAIDFLEKYYNEALYCSMDFKNMLIEPLKQFSPDRFSETNIYDVKITHRYGISKSTNSATDMGIINTANPFSFVIHVDESEHYEEDIALLAEFAYNFNVDYGTLLLSQMTTLPDVPDQDKKTYDSKTVSETPLMVIVIVSTVVIAAGITIAYIVHENKKKNQDRLD